MLTPQEKPGFTISLPGSPAEPPAEFSSLADYLDHYDHLDELVEPVLERAIEGGFINPERAAVLAAWFQQNPLIAEIYPYRQLCRALDIALADGGWTEEIERGLLQFFAAQSELEHLMDLPINLFGDMYLELFDHPDGVLPMEGMPIEVTGPCLCGSHRQMYRMAEQLGGVQAKSVMYKGYLFVARSHIENRVFSSKIMEIVHARRRGRPLLILDERAFPGWKVERSRL